MGMRELIGHLTSVHGNNDIETKKDDSLIIRREKRQTEFLDNASDMIKALSGNQQVGFRMLNRESETFGQYPLTELLFDVGTFAVGAGVGGVVEKVTLGSMSKIAKKLAEDSLVRKATKTIAETTAGTIAQGVGTGTLATIEPTENGNIKANIDPYMVGGQVLTNLPFEGAFKVANLKKAKNKSNPNSEDIIKEKIENKTQEETKKDYIFQDGEYKKNVEFPFDYIPDKETKNAKVNLETEKIYVNEGLHKKAMNGDEEALDTIQNFLHHENGHIESFKNNRIKNKDDLNKEEYVRHLDTFINAILDGNLKLAEEIEPKAREYAGKTGMEPTAIADIIDYINSADVIKRKDISKIIKSDPIVQSWIGSKKNFIYKGDEELFENKTPKRKVQYKILSDDEIKKGLKYVQNPDMLKQWIEKTYGIKSPNIEFADFNGLKNGKIYISKTQKPKEKLISAVHEAIHYQDINTGTNAKTSPKPSGSPDELYTYANDFIIATQLKDKKLMQHSMTNLLKHTDILPTEQGTISNKNRITVKYIIQNIDRTRKAKKQNIDMNFIYDFLKEPRVDDIPRFIDEIDKLREHKLATEKHDLTLSGRPDIVTEKLMSKYKLDRNQAEELTSKAITQYDYNDILKSIDNDTFFEKTEIKNPKSMSKQQSLKNKLYEMLSKQTEELGSSGKEQYKPKIDNLQYDKISVKKNIIDKLYKDITKSLINDKEFIEYAKDTFRENLRKKLSKRNISEKQKNEFIEKEINKIFTNDYIEHIVEKRLGDKDFKHELELNLESYMEPVLDGNIIDIGRIKLDNVKQYFINNTSKSKKIKKNESLNKKLEKVESSKIDEIYENRIKKTKNKKEKKESEKNREEKIKKENKEIKDNKEVRNNKDVKKNKEAENMNNNTKRQEDTGKNKNEENKKAQKNRKDKTRERVELRYAKSIPETEKRFKPKNIIKNDIEIKEYLKAEDYAKDKMGTYYEKVKKAFSAGGSKYMEAVTAMHEFLHGIYPHKTEKQIIEESFSIINDLIKKDSDFANRLDIPKEARSKLKTKEYDKKIFEYIYGNQDMTDVLFGSSEKLKTEFDKIEEHFSKFINNSINKTKIKEKIKNFYENSNQIVKDIISETLEEDYVAKRISHLKKEAEIIITNNIKMLNSKIDEFSQMYSKEKISGLFIAGMYRHFEPNEALIFNRKLLIQRYRELSKKYKNLQKILNHSLDPMGTKKYSLNSIKEFKNKFKDDYIDVLTILAIKRYAYKTKDKKANISKEMLYSYKKIAKIIDELNPLDEEIRIVGYYPHILDTTYDIKIGITESQKNKLKKNGYKEFKDNIFYKREYSPTEMSELFFYKNDEKKFGFNTIMDEQSAKEARRILGNKVKIIKIDKNKYEVRYQPSRQALKDLVDLADDIEVIATYTYKKNIEEFFNKNIFAKKFKEELERLGTNESEIVRGYKNTKEIKYDKDFITIDEKTDRTKVRILNEIFNKNNTVWQINKKYKDYFFNKEILPKNKNLAIAFKIWKSLVGKMKWHLTGLSVSAFNNAIVGGTLNLLYIGVNPKRIYRLAKETLEEYKEFQKYMNKYNQILENYGFSKAQQFLHNNKKNNTFIEVMIDSEVGSLIENPNIILGRGRTYADNVLLEELKKIDRKFGTSIAKNIYNGFRYFTLDRTTAIGKFLLNKYTSIDLFQRVMSYKYMKTRYGKNEAIKKINDIFVDFGKLQKPINNAIDMGIVPFWTWTLRMQGGLLRITKDRPLSVASMIGVYATLQYMFDEEYKYDEYAGNLRIESWFIHNVFADTMLLDTNLATQFYKGKIDKVLENMFLPKTYEELMAVSKGEREPMELAGFNFKPKWLEHKRN